MAIDHQGIKQDAYSLFIQSIPYNFFSIVIILVGIYLSFFHHSTSTAPMNLKKKKKIGMIVILAYRGICLLSLGIC